MSTYRTKFPGRPVKRYTQGSIKHAQKVSYRSRDSQDRRMSEELSLIEAEIVSRSKVFQQLFGSCDDENVNGFDEVLAEKLKDKYDQIKYEIQTLQIKLCEFGVKPAFFAQDDPTAHILPNFRPREIRLTRTSADPVVPVQSGCAVATLITTEQPSCSPVPITTEQPSCSSAPITTEQSGCAAAKEPRKLSEASISDQEESNEQNPKSVFTTPLSPLSVCLIPTEAYTVPIDSIPVIKYARDIPFHSGLRSGKFIVEVESDSDSNSDMDFELWNDIENLDFLGDLDVGGKAEEADQTEKSLVRLNQCPIEMQDIQEFGFPVIIDRARGPGPATPLCFTCGSSGIGELIFCSSCCEPYHPFCTGDDLMLSTYVPCIISTVIDANQSAEFVQRPNSSSSNVSVDNSLFSSFLSPPPTPASETVSTSDDNCETGRAWIEFKKFLRTWTCSRCYICYVCKGHLPPNVTNSQAKFLKCPHCPRVVHVSCCAGGRRGISSNQNTRVCERCFKCSSCGKRLERRPRQGGDQPLCSDCVRQKKKGSYCPLCSVCYDDNDFEVKMMECAKCEHWIHADCENISSEEYQILGNLPESVEFICRTCEDPENVYWRLAISLKIESDWKEVFQQFQTDLKISMTQLPEQIRSLENTPTKVLKTVDQNTINSPSKESTPKIVRNLFPKKVESSTGENTKELSKFNLKSSSDAESLNRRCCVLLQDCKKFPQLSLAQNQKALPQPVKLGEPIVELVDYKSPIKGHAPPMRMRTPSKHSALIAPLISELNSLQLRFSIKSVYKRALNLIQTLQEKDASLNFNSQFESAFLKVFSWFNLDDLEVKDTENEENEASWQVQSFDEDTYKGPLDMSPEVLAAWNPFEQVYWQKGDHRDTRVCSFCQKIGDSKAEFCGRLLWAGLSEWVHINCALWSSEVWEGEDGALKQVGVALSRSKGLSCMDCGEKGASVSCCVQSCTKSFHFPCALQGSCTLLADKGMFCSDHVNRAKGPKQLDMRVLRQVHVDTEWMRKKDKCALSSDIGVYIGSLKVESLGHIAALSVYKEASEDTRLIPLGYKVSRIFWSVDPFSQAFEKAKYSVTTGIKKQAARKAKYCRASRDVNIRVDHTKSLNRVNRKLKQVKSFHDWLDSTPTYIDEYREEWLRPCGLRFPDSESSASDADADDSEQEAYALSSASTLSDGYAPSSASTASENYALSTASTISMDEDFSDLANFPRDRSDPRNRIEVEVLRTDTETDDFEDSDAETVIEDFLDNTFTGKIELRTIHEEDEDVEFSEEIRLTALIKRRFQTSIPQLDGGGESDSDSASSYSSASSEESSSDEEEVEVARNQPIRKKGVSGSRLTKAGSVSTSKKGRSDQKDRPSSASAAKSKGGPAFGGRNLRSRKKLQDAKMASQKKQGFKCSGCKKEFSSQTSLGRHSKWCKGKKAGKKDSVEKSLPKKAIEAKPEKSKRGRKAKKPKTSPVVTSGPSSQVRRTFHPSEEVSQLRRLKISAPATEEPIAGTSRKALEASQSMSVSGDGKVYCRRCKNTYRTSASYSNHLGSCFYLSSDDDEEEADEAPLDDEAPPAFSPAIQVPKDADSETLSDASSSVDETPNQSLDDSQRERLPTNEQEVEQWNEQCPGSENFETQEAVSENASQVVQEEEQAYAEEIGETTSAYEQENNQNAEILFSDEQNIALEAQQDEDMEEVQEDEYEAEADEASHETATAPDQLIPGQLPAGEIMQTYPDLPRNAVQIPCIEQILAPVAEVPPPVTHGLPPWIPHQQILAGGATGPDFSGASQASGFQAVSNFHSNQQRSNDIQEQIPPSVQIPAFQNVQNLQNLQMQQQSFQQQSQTSPAGFQYQTPPQQLQTFTFQDSNTGQLMTFQVPVAQQQQQLPAQNTSFMQQTFQNNMTRLNQQNDAQAQYEQYKQQIQAAIQLQRNSLLQQQQTLYQQQQPRFENQLLLSQEQRLLAAQQQIQLQNQLQHSQNTSASMLMPMNPNMLQQHQHSAQSQIIRHHSQTPDGMTTYMVVQQGNSQTLQLPSAQSVQSIQHRAFQLGNLEHGQRPLTPSPQHSSILVNTQESHSPKIQEQSLQTNHNCSRAAGSPHQATAPCTCVDCLRGQNTVHNVLDFGQPCWTIPKPTAVTNVRKPKTTGKIRARLASIVSERQGQGLQLFRTMTSPSSTLPKLLPATAVSTPATTATPIFSTVPTLTLNAAATSIVPTVDPFKPPHPISTVPATATATTVTSDSLTGPIVSASTAPTLLKAPTPSPIAVVRPMEHPLQKISNQIQQLGSTFTSPPVTSQSIVNLTPVIPEPPPVRLIPPSTSSNSNVSSLMLTTALPEADAAVETSQGPAVVEPEPMETEIKEIKESVPVVQEPEASPEQTQNADKSIKIRLKRQAGGDSYSINKISGSTATSNNQYPGMFKTLKIKGKITTGDQAGTSTDVVVQPVVYTIPIPDPDAGDDKEANRTIAEDESAGSDTRTCLETSVVLPVDMGGGDEEGKPRKTQRLTHRAVIVYEVKIDDKIQYKSCDVNAVWGYILERVQGTRRNHNLPPMAYPATNISLSENKREAAASFNKLGLTHRAVQFLLEQLPGVKNAAKEGHVFKFQEPPKTSVEDTPVAENPTGAARSEGFTGRKPFDMFGWLASKHRQPDTRTVSTRGGSEKAKGGSLPMAMQYRNLIKFGTKHLNVFWSSIHGRGLFTTRDIETNDVIIEYAGEVIRPVLCDLREKYYESKGIGCYMFRIDDNSVVDATLKGNAARFINHSCDPNCRSKTIDILGKKHILIFALRKIIAGEELTYDYKFEEEGEKLPCSCGTKKCRKFLN